MQLSLGIGLGAAGPNNEARLPKLATGLAYLRASNGVHWTTRTRAYWTGRVA